MNFPSIETKEDYDEFKQAFWCWFDSLSIEEKKKFWYYGEDIAETNFFFRFFSKKIEENCFICYK